MQKTVHRVSVTFFLKKLPASRQQVQLTHVSSFHLYLMHAVFESTHTVSKTGRYEAKIMHDDCKRMFTSNAMNEMMALKYRYIKWTQATFKAGGHKAELMPLLERCTRQLQQQDRYKKDSRYLRLWIQYVSLSSSELPNSRSVHSI
jgi:hypothetical protein